MIMHPESLYALQRQQHAHLIRQAELDRLARAIRQRRPSLLSLSRYPVAVTFARRTWDTITGFFAGSRREAGLTPGLGTGSSTTAVSAAAVGAGLTRSTSVGPR